MVHRLAFFVLALTLAIPVQAGESGPPEKRTEASLKARIDGLIRKLGSEEWKDREQATLDLIEIGEPALKALAEAQKSEDPEVRLRARRIVSKIREKAHVRPPLKRTPPKKQVRPFPVPDPWNEDWADLMKRLLEDPFRRPGERDGEGREDRDWKEWEKKLDERMRRFREGGIFGGFDKDLRELLKKLEEQRGRVPWSGEQRSVITRNGETIEVGRDGKGKVWVVIKGRGEHGKPQEKRYEAPSEEEFKNKYPEVHKKYVEGRFGRVRIFLNPGVDPFKEWRKQMDEMLRKHRKQLDPGEWRRRMEERMRRLRAQRAREAREGGAGSVRMVYRDGDVTVEIQRTGKGEIRLVLRRTEKDGRLVEDRYEAGSEDEFSRKYPGIYGKYVKGKLNDRGIHVELRPHPSRLSKRPDIAGFGIRPGNVSELMRVHLSIPPGVGFVVDEVGPGSRAEKAGFRKFDLVLKAAGLYVTHPVQIESLLRTGEGPLEVEIIRRGVKTSISIDR